MAYNIPATAKTPALIIFLLDISGSMQQKVGGIPRIDAVQELLRKIIVKMVQRSTKGNTVSPRYRVAMFAYSSQVIDLLGGIKTITELAQLGIPRLTTLTNTNMEAAFVAVENLLKQELPNMHSHPAPLVIHFTDGEYDDLVPVVVVKRIMDMEIPDGNVLIENIYLEQDVNVSNKYSKFFSEISSPIPDSYRYVLQEYGYNLDKNAKLFFSADRAEIVELGFAMCAATPITTTQEERRAQQEMEREKFLKIKGKIIAQQVDRDALELVAHRNAELEAKEKLKHRKEKPISKQKKNLEISVSNPKLLSKRFASAFMLQIYIPEERPQVMRNIKSEFADQNTREYIQLSSLSIGKKIRVKLFSPIIDFPDPVIKSIDQPINKVVLLGMPKDKCETGSHKISISISDADKGQELESFTVTVYVVDFAFDHISRPLLSRASATILGIGSFAMFILTILEQIDKTVGLTSGTAAGVLAIGIYASFYNLYQRVRPNTP
jgi:uncharacterized protein YegL